MIFGKKGPNELTEEERQAIISKIEKKYRENSQRYGGHAFDLEKFYDRYNNAIRDRRNEEAFLLAEVQAIIDFENNKKEEEEERKRNATTVIADIYKEFDQRLDGYRRETIHEKAEKEIECLLGCILDFEKKYFHFYEDVNKELYINALRVQFEKISNLMLLLGSHGTGDLPKEFLLYRDKVDRSKGREEVQKHGHKILKLVFEFFNRIQEYQREVLKQEERLKEISFEMYEEQFTFREITQLVNQEISHIFHDFRLKGLNSDAFL